MFVNKLYKLLSILFFLLAISNFAQASIINLVSEIDGVQAGFPNSGGSGSAAMTFDDITNKLTWGVEWSGLIGNVTVAHFHGPASPGKSAGIQVPIDVNSNPAVGMATLDDIQESDLLEGLWYINIHSDFAPLGEIRGQVNVVPLPAAIWFFGAGLFGLIGMNGAKKRG